MNDIRGGVTSDSSCEKATHQHSAWKMEDIFKPAYVYVSMAALSCTVLAMSLWSVEYYTVV